MWYLYQVPVVLFFAASAVTSSLSSYKFTRETCPRGQGPYLRFNETLPPFSYPLVTCPLQSAFTCCDHEQDKRLQSLYVSCTENQLTFGCCQTLKNLNCYGCDGIIALGGTKHGICADSVCTVLYRNCANDYFTMDEGNRIIPCTEESLLCTPLSNLIHYLPSPSSSTTNQEKRLIEIDKDTNDNPSTALSSDPSSLSPGTLYSLCSAFGYPLTTNPMVPCYDPHERITIPSGYHTVNKTRKISRPRSSSSSSGSYDYDNDNPYYSAYAAEPLTLQNILQQYQRLFRGELRENDTFATLSVAVVFIGVFMLWWKRLRSRSTSSSSSSSYTYRNFSASYGNHSPSASRTDGYTLTSTSPSVASTLTPEQLREQRLQYFSSSPKLESSLTSHLPNLSIPDTDTVQYTSSSLTDAGTPTETR